MKTKKEIRKCCLTIAGSDSGGNAGIQADLRAFRAFGLHGCTVLTALTAQNPFGVYSVKTLSPDFVLSQLDAVLGVYDIGAVKIGMMPTSGVARTVYGFLEEKTLCSKPSIVIDPVMVATSGAHLADEKSVRRFENSFYRFASLLTPNIPEAQFLAGRNDLGQVDMAKCLYERYRVPVLVKGGHSSAGNSDDVLCHDNCEIVTFKSKKIKNPVSTHGTGCTLSSAITANLCLGLGLEEAIATAKNYVYKAIENSYLVGANCGVLGM